ncbi:MAG: carbohydrate kinase [Maritimibacter sp.]|nr:carbohydrate kinase [Maritimibacter sp.]
MTADGLIAVGGENLIDHVTRDGVATGYPGGSPVNVAIALGRQGAKVAYLSPISTDAWGDRLAAALEGAGVRLTGGRRAEPTTMARVTIADGIPSYRFERRGTAERMVTEAALHAALPEAAVAVHTGSLTLTDGADAEVWEAFCAGCYHGGRVVSLDPNVRLSVVENVEGYRARLLRMCERVHILKLSDEDLAALLPGRTQAEALADLRRLSSARLLVLTEGARGARAWYGGAEIAVPPARVGALVDTVGAGDTFTATLLAGLAAQGAMSPQGLETLDRATLAALLRRASVAAALNCGREGCDPPGAAEIDAALAAVGDRKG